MTTQAQQHAADMTVDGKLDGVKVAAEFSDQGVAIGGAREVDQDWDLGTTTIRFEDGSALVLTDHEAFPVGHARISINNGATFDSPENLSADDVEFVETHWDDIANLMDVDAMQRAGEIEGDDKIEFLIAYLATAPDDLVIG